MNLLRFNIISVTKYSTNKRFDKEIALHTRFISFMAQAMIDLLHSKLVMFSYDDKFYFIMSIKIITFILGKNV